jgi:hypothetical protein
MANKQQTLQEVFGFDSFRPLQEQAVDKILAEVSHHHINNFEFIAWINKNIRFFSCGFKYARFCS